MNKHINLIYILFVCIALVSFTPKIGITVEKDVFLYKNSEQPVGEIIFSVPDTLLNNVPDWVPGQSNPPLDITSAMKLAIIAAKKRYPPNSKYDDYFIGSITIKRITNTDIDNKWFYIIGVLPIKEGRIDKSLWSNRHLVVLMDGAVIEPRFLLSGTDNIKNIKLKAYLDAVHYKISRLYYDAIKEHGYIKPTKVCEFSIVIAIDGSISRISIHDTSGNDLIDTAIYNLMKRSATLPKPPKELLDLLQYNIEVQFMLNINSFYPIINNEKYRYIPG